MFLHLCAHETFVAETFSSEEPKTISDSFQGQFVSAKNILGSAMNPHQFLSLYMTLKIVTGINNMQKIKDYWNRVTC